MFTQLLKVCCHCIEFFFFSSIMAILNSRIQYSLMIFDFEIVFQFRKAQVTLVVFAIELLSEPTLPWALCSKQLDMLNMFKLQIVSSYYLQLIFCDPVVLALDYPSIPILNFHK